LPAVFGAAGGGLRSNSSAPHASALRAEPGTVLLDCKALISHVEKGGVSFCRFAEIAAPECRGVAGEFRLALALFRRSAAAA
jgi:hypothetical protein